MFNFSVLLYIGPGLGLGAIVIVALIVLIILASLLLILWLPLKRMFKRIKGFFSK